MTLYTTDYLEYYLTLVGWLIHNGIWNLLLASGLFALPFLLIVVQEWLHARTVSTDESQQSLLSSRRIESRMLLAIGVIAFAAIPMIPVSLNTLQFDMSRSRQCQVDVAAPAKTGWALSYTQLNGQQALIPVWWFFVHALSKAVTGAAIAAIPCGTDLRQIRMELDATRIADPLLAQEVADFTRECYGPSRARLFMQRPGLAADQRYDVTWIGSRYFLNSPGFYDIDRARTPRAAWPYEATRDAGLTPGPTGAGYPLCRQWWSDPGRGLRERLLTQVDAGLLNRLAQWAGFVSRQTVDDAVIRAVVAPRQQKLNQGQVYTDYGGQVDMSLPNMAARLAGDTGLALGSLGFFPAMDVVRQALPMVLSLLKMALVIGLPLLLVIGTYDLKTTLTLSTVQFALFFVEFWFQLARWLDSTILDALYGWGFGAGRPHRNFDPLIGLNNAFGDLLLNFSMATMFIAFPTFWMTALTWVGLRVGAALQALASGTQDARRAGARGTDAVRQGMR